MNHSSRPSMGMQTHLHRNSFSAATYTNTFGTPQPQQRQVLPPRNASLECPWPVYAVDWSPWQNDNRIAIGSFCDDIGNRLQVLRADEEVYKVAEIDATLPYPVTKVMWEPQRKDKQNATMIATSGDFLRIFSIAQNDGRSVSKISQEVLLGNTKTESPAPLTSFDWNRVDSSIIVTASVDTTCTIWDLNTAQARTQLIAHDKEVFDVAFTANTTDIFASVGSDGSVRLFDLRSLEHSTILYESPPPSKHPLPSPASSPTTSPCGAPLLRIAASERDSNLLATFHADSSIIQILDIRQPGNAILQLDAHAGPVNAIKWSPNARNLLASAGDDCQVLIWDCNAPVDTATGANRIRDPALSWTADSEINNISWSNGGDKLAACYGKTVQSLKL